MFLPSPLFFQARRRHININFWVQLRLGRPAVETNPVCPRDKPRLSQGQRGFLLILHIGSPVCPWDKPVLSLDTPVANGGRKCLCVKSLCALFAPHSCERVSFAKCKLAPSTSKLQFLYRTTQKSPLPYLHFGGCQLAFWKGCVCVRMCVYVCICVICVYIYMCAVELLSGPSLGFLEVIIWSKFVFFLKHWLPKNTIQIGVSAQFFGNKNSHKNNWELLSGPSLRFFLNAPNLDQITTLNLDQIITSKNVFLFVFFCLHRLIKKRYVAAPLLTQNWCFFELVF